MVSGGAQPPDGEASGPSASLIRHRWLTAAGTTATVAAMAGGGVALIQHGPAAGQHRDCGLVPCSATLPSSVTASATGPGRSPDSARPFPHPAHSAGRAGTRAGSHAQAPPVPAAQAAGAGQSADHQVGVRYEIRPRSGRTVTGHLVISNHGGVPVTGWQLRLVLPGDGRYQVANAAGVSAGDSLLVTALPDQAALGAGQSVRVAFIAVGRTAVPASVTFQDSAAGQPASSGSTTGLGTGGQPSQAGWPGWTGGWRGPQQNGYGGWPFPGQGGGPTGWSGPGPGGWPGGR